MSSSPPDPLAIRLPVPFPIGGVNAYLLRGEPLTLVDPGPRSPEALAALESALRAEGLRIEDIELIVLTHHHVDHAGLAETVRRRAQCAVAAHGVVAALTEDEPAARVAEDAWELALMELHGVPAEILATVPEISRAAQTWTESVAVDRVLEDGGILRAGGTDLEVHLRPGHSPGDTLFVRGDRRALVADHLLQRHPVALLAHRPHAGPADPRARPSAMLAYRESLAATAADDLVTAWPGHGAPIGRPTDLIAERLVAHETRATETLGMLTRGARTAWDVVEAMRGARQPGPAKHPMTLAFIALSEVLAHLDLLIATGRARVIDDGDRLRFEAAAVKTTGW